MNTAVFVFVNEARVGKCFQPCSEGEESIITLLIVKWSKGELGLLGVLCSVFRLYKIQHMTGAGMITGLFRLE